MTPSHEKSMREQVLEVLTEAIDLAEVRQNCPGHPSADEPLPAALSLHSVRLSCIKNSISTILESQGLNNGEALQILEKLAFAIMKTDPLLLKMMEIDTFMAPHIPETKFTLEITTNEDKTRRIVVSKLKAGEVVARKLVSELGFYRAMANAYYESDGFDRR